LPKRPPTSRGIGASTSAQTRNALGVIRTRNVLTKKEETIGSWNERFADTGEDIAAYLNAAFIALTLPSLPYAATMRTGIG
jgi:hypothetical protein